MCIRMKKQVPVSSAAWDPNPEKIKLEQTDGDLSQPKVYGLCFQILGYSSSLKTS